MRRGKGLELGKPGGPDGPPIEVERTLAFKTGYYGALVVLWGLLVATGLGLGALIAHLAF